VFLIDYLIHGKLLINILPESGRKKEGATPAHDDAFREKTRGFLISFIRTVTVGSGISPDLLTPPERRALAGSPDKPGYRR